ncbi:alpha/beta hydrolase [Actinoplanes sp. ATCC 53533]|uniref:alpha/beta fold hydrolase n=1 Tax=Actinoplanes sp. ATCC 53533 TaxID=1288362 RepID=UPI000F7AFED5|nr:alpha/beta hydrolase [Actinoplanes sp. ATCC 53533]RSM72155.1 alpha/beta hydrolase [Actinoplanes sp. ATCC 53533]
MPTISHTESSIRIPRTRSQFLEPIGSRDQGHQGRLRYLTGGSGAPLVLLHTVRTQAEHFRHLLLGESLGATLVLTAAADLPDRVRRVVSVNPYDYAGGIARSSLLARLIVTGVITPGIGSLLARLEPKPVMRAILAGGLGDPAALREDYLDELLKVGHHPGYSTVARAVYRNLPSLIAARARYPQVTAPVHLIYGEQDWSRPSDRQANRRQLPDAEFTQVPKAGHFVALERPDVPADLLNSVA